LAAAGCGVENPVTYSSIGYPDINLIINVYGDVSAGIEDVTPISIQSWPNPATDMLYMDMPQGIWTVELLNVNGQRILQAEVSGKGSLDVSQLPAGMYILRATDGTRLMQDKVFIR
ncbi:MAG TPA: T9SS type A sorting domain-containing protein, partial [Bacteroidales bacterium]|nr:T9SS type A sorting domain-containing protein [Bacteroidales bacterium]